MRNGKQKSHDQFDFYLLPVPTFFFMKGAAE